MSGFKLGYRERDVVSLGQRLYDPAASSGGVLKLTARECRALPELNRRTTESMPKAILYPFVAWVEGRGLRPLRKAG